jgi:REP element-mobilizing transposase RayT
MPKRDLVEGETYHFYNRGILKNDLFLCDEDFLRFMCLVKVSNQNDTKPLSNILKTKTIEEVLQIEYRKDFVDIDIGRLMPNHWHLSGRSKVKGGAAKFMKRVLGGYAVYFNKKYEKSGYTFEGRYKSRQIKDEADFMNLMSYIKMNPLSLIRDDYSHEKYMKGGIILTDKEKDFIEIYPYRLE